MSQDTSLELNGLGFKDVVDCDTCTSACCRSGVKIPLKTAEKKQLEERGTTFGEVEQPHFGTRTRKFSRAITAVAVHIRPKQEEPIYYEMLSDCGNLTVDAEGQSMCSDYDNRPDICLSFQAGNFACRSLRVKAGVDTPRELEIWKDFKKIDC